MYSKTGCFAEYNKNNLHQHHWNVDNKYNSLINTVEITIVSTHLTVFYFSKIEGGMVFDFS
jgi:hypothetical protein